MQKLQLVSFQQLVLSVQLLRKLSVKLSPAVAGAGFIGSIAHVLVSGSLQKTHFRICNYIINCLYHHW